MATTLLLRSNEKAFRSSMGRRTGNLFVQVIHILKLGLDHDRIKIYIYFADAKSVFYFSESNGQPTDLKLPVDS